jgi:PTS system nitrogen regulatory IIA component
MIFSEFIKKDLIQLKIPCTSKDDLILKLIEAVYETGQNIPISKNELTEKINTREKIGGTLLPSGLSIPHARLKGYEDFIIALGTPSTPLLHDELKVHLVALMVSSQSGGEHYLPTLAALTKLSRDEVFFLKLCDSDNTDDFIGILKERDGELP